MRDFIYLTTLYTITLVWLLGLSKVLGLHGPEGAYAGAVGAICFDLLRRINALEDKIKELESIDKRLKNPLDISE